MRECVIQCIYGRSRYAFFYFIFIMIYKDNSKSVISSCIIVCKVSFFFSLVSWKKRKKKKNQNLRWFSAVIVCLRNLYMAGLHSMIFLQVKHIFFSFLFFFPFPTFSSTNNLTQLGNTSLQTRWNKIFKQKKKNSNKKKRRINWIVLNCMFIYQISIYYQHKIKPYI